MDQDTLLFGHTHEPGIVGLHPIGNHRMRVYRRDEEGALSSYDDDFYPFLIVSDEIVDALTDAYYPRKVVPMGGPGRRNRIVVCSDYRQFHGARRWCADQAEPTDWLTPPSLASQYLQYTGKTLFEERSMDDIVRMQFDIEVVSPSGQFPSAERARDEIVIIAITTNQGTRRVLHTASDVAAADLALRDEHVVACADEERLLREFIREVHRRDPDTLEGHNHLSFDLPYLRDRAKRHGVNFALGRDGSRPRSYSQTKSFAEATIEYENFQVAGRHCIDSMFMAIDFDVYARSLPGYGLKELAQHFNIAAPDRSYVEGDDITDTWQTDPGLLIQYALDDVIETRALIDEIGGATYQTTKALPLTYQGVQQAGTAASIEALMSRAYIQSKEAIPAPSDLGYIEGGYTDIFQRGVFEDLCYADISSLYPTNMLKYELAPESDSLGVFLKMLRALTEERLRMKQRLDKLDAGHEKERLDAKQASYKILINSFYGAAGFQFFPWNSESVARDTTRMGRKLLFRLIHEIKARGGTPILTDTDGVMFQLPQAGMSDKEVDALITSISEAMPTDVVVDNDGRFDRVLSYKPKNYAKKERGSDTLSIVGNSLKGRNLEPFLSDYIEHQIGALLRRDIERAWEVHHGVKALLARGDVPIDKLQKRARLKKRLSDYEEGVQNDPNKTRLPQYEIAKRARDLRGAEPLPGDTFYYWIEAGSGPKYQRARLPEEYEPGREDTEGYLERLDHVADIFRPLVRPHGAIYGMEIKDAMGDLFGAPDLSGVRVVQERVGDLPANPDDVDIYTEADYAKTGD